MSSLTGAPVGQKAFLVMYTYDPRLRQGVRPGQWRAQG